jgi:hypothetical protein
VAATKKKLPIKPIIAVAFCDASGVIEFGPTCPPGRLPIAAGPRAKLERLIIGACRHGYDGTTLLVPGIPEADSQSAGLDALKAFRERNRAYWTKEGLEV